MVGRRRCAATIASLDPQLSTLNSQLTSAIRAFIGWLDRVGYDSYDPYDLWGTKYGLFARRLYYKKNPFGLPLIAPIVAVETLCPSLRTLFVRKQRFATADAQLLLAFLNLHELLPSPPRMGRGLGEVSKSEGSQPSTINHQLPSASQPSTLNSQPSLIARARTLADDLLKLSIPGYQGHCWGYPFDWQNNRGLWVRHTPFITSTPYCYEAFVKLAEATGEKRYLDVAESAARFVFHDLNDTPTSATAAAGSYGPHDRTFVINASAYRAWLLFDAAERFGIPDYRRKAELNLNFILESQRPDGSWLYALNSPAEAFIDHFHTCFVLKNLFKLNRSLRSERVRKAIDDGYGYYRRALFDSEGLPKSFAIVPRTQLVRFEMYNFAEAITLGVLLREELPPAFADAKRLGQLLIERYQVSAGHFVTRVFRGGWKHRFPFLRWPQAQLFYALTNLLRALTSPKATMVAQGNLPTESGGQRHRQVHEHV